MVQEWLCKENQRGYDSTRGEEERGPMGDQILATNCQLYNSSKILSCALNKPIISFFDYFQIIECMCEVSGKSHLMHLLKHGTHYSFVTVLSTAKSQSTTTRSPFFYYQKLCQLSHHHFLISLGVNPHSLTLSHRSPLHRALYCSSWLCITHEIQGQSCNFGREIDGCMWLEKLGKLGTISH